MTTRVDCPHCGNTYLKRGLNTHIGRMHKEKRKLVQPVGKRTVVSVEISDNIPDLDATPAQPIPTVEGATYTKWQRFVRKLKR